MIDWKRVLFSVTLTCKDFSYLLGEAIDWKQLEFLVTEIGCGLVSYSLGDAIDWNPTNQYGCFKFMV